MGGAGVVEMDPIVESGEGGIGVLAVLVLVVGIVSIGVEVVEADVVVVVVFGVGVSWGNGPNFELGMRNWGESNLKPDVVVALLKVTFVSSLGCGSAKPTGGLNG